MKEILLTLNSARKYEKITTAEYFWDCSVRKDRAAIFQYSWSGSGIYSGEKGEQEVPRGYAFLAYTPEKSKYYYPASTKKAWELGWINFNGAESLWRFLRETYGSVVPLWRNGHAIMCFEEVVRHYEQKTFLDRYHTGELLYRFLMALARELSDSTKVKSSDMKWAQEYLVDHHQELISIEDVSDRMDMTREHFIRKFKQTTGISPGVFLRELRMKTARRLLQTTRSPIKSVADQSGFASSSHFCRAFRKQFGVSPEAFRGIA